MLLLGNDIEKMVQTMERAGPYATVAVVGAAVLLVVYLSRAIENYVRHLHKKPYLPYSTPRFIISTLGFMLVAAAFVVLGVFESRLPLHTGTVTLVAGILLLILSTVLSLRPYWRQARQVGREENPKK